MKAGEVRRAKVILRLAGGQSYREQERRESGQDTDLGGFWYHPLLDSVDAGSIDHDRIRGPWTPPLLIVGFLGWVIVILGAWGDRHNPQTGQIATLSL
jgi:hypothetical protein